MYIPESENRHPIFDQIPEQNFDCPWPRWKLRRFQDDINRLAGLSSNAKPNLRIIWPADADPEVSMHWVDGELKARYRLYTQVYQCTGVNPVSGLSIVQDVDVDITSPRFMVEEFHETDEEGFTSCPDQYKGQGQYTHLFTVAVHSEKCCFGTESVQGHVCLGLYREPGEPELEEIRRRLYLRDKLDASDAHKPGERVSMGEVSHSLLQLKEWEQRQSETRKKLFRDAALSGFMPHYHKIFSDDPGVHSHGRFHFMPTKVKEN